MTILDGNDRQQWSISAIDNDDDDDYDDNDVNGDNNDWAIF